MRFADCGSSLPFDEIVLLDDPEPRAATLNMAIDEVLLSGLAHLPMLRCYRWAGRAVSFGCFGHIADVRRNYPDTEIVRRWTGGGTVRHGNDFTYTLLVPRTVALGAVPANESYRHIHAALAVVLANRESLMGLETAFHEQAFGAPSLQPGIGASHLKACFEHPVANDLLFAGRKIAGGAQRRTLRGLLHQGSIQNSGFTAPKDQTEHLRFARQLAVQFARRLTQRALSEEELGAAYRLANEKYGSNGWMEKH